MFIHKFNQRSTELELLDILDINEKTLPLVIQNLQEFELINKKLGSLKTLKLGLNQVYQKNIDKMANDNNKINIIDLGCGAGDLTQGIYQWAVEKNLSVSIKGIDINPHIIRYAEEKFDKFKKNKNRNAKISIQFEVMDIFCEQLKMEKYDIVCLNNICHHMDTLELKNLLSGLIRKTKIAIIINDLQRHWISYYFIKSITRLFSFSSLAKNDGPLSVLKAFSKKELLEILDKLDTPSTIGNFQINWIWPFRWLGVLYANSN